MNIEQLIQGIITEITPYLDVSKIEVSFYKETETRISHPNKVDIYITIFYDRHNNNFTTYFYGNNPKPKSIKAVVSGILAAAKEQKVPLRKPAKNEVSEISNPEVL